MMDPLEKVRISLMSDLHIEFEGPRPGKGPDLSDLKGNIDLVLLAGDIDVSDRAIKYGAKIHDDLDCEVLLIAGNHEFYDENRVRVLAEMRRAADASPVNFLENDVAYYNIRGRRVRILGCTLWTDYELHGDQAHVDSVMAEIATKLNDHFVIYEGSRYKFRPDDALRLHRESRAWLESELVKPFDGLTIIITHHAPSERSMPTRHMNSRISPAYASNLDGLVERCRAALWVHGHTHESFDYMIGETRVICNPRGYYAHELNPGFSPNLIIEL
jgi:predicted phosphodiesterase